ncbi:MAG: hypothetical protein AAGA86_12590 [Bacteroidota bacterium]
MKKARHTSREGNLRLPDEAARAGDSYAWQWHNWDGKEEGTVLEANGRDFLRTSFSESRVAVHIPEVGDRCLLTLRQYNIPTDVASKYHSHLGCSNSWTFWLADLKAFLK